MKRIKAKKKHNHYGVKCILVVVAILLVTLTVQSRELSAKNHAYAEQQAKLQKQIEDEKQRTQDIAALEEYMQSDEYVEKIAKDKLGLVYQDEILFKPES